MSPCAAWQREKERRTRSFLPNSRRAPAMGFRGLLYDRKAEPRPRRLMPRFLGPIESLEDPFAIRRRNRRTLIVNADHNLSQILLGRDGNRRSRRRVLDRKSTRLNSSH